MSQQSQHPLKTHLKETPREAALKKITLVLEQGDSGAWVLPVLPHLLSPSQSACKLVQAMGDISHGGWLQAEPETFWQVISNRRKILQKAQANYQHTLENKGFYVVENEITDTSHEGQVQLLQSLKETPQDLLVLACRQTGVTASATPPLIRYQTSGFMTHLASHAPCSVLMLKPGLSLYAEERLKVLLATDDAQCSRRAARVFSKLFNTHRMDIILLTVLDPMYLENPVMAPYVNIPAIDEALRQNAELTLTTSQGLLEAEGIPVVKQAIKTGGPAWEILQAIDAEKPHLVVMGSHRPNHDGLWALGSVSHKVMQSSACSVLIVR